ncbi:SHOCT domain-containing protein [Natronorubrum daqingense]|uniref:Putative membrane protein n=1 Tax=Natronorubrum daqingense TaxID=588898 RepID=A0A1N7EKX2_9EURY|nr:SHOCT domain-containing protein [Natronorubrum daqingense]APX97886.1 hypothetical protein BB347_15390 [Natronorubrum daqingense]SIR88736.1 putative membrane protein [Natronorubrum daqingense]
MATEDSLVRTIVIVVAAIVLVPILMMALMMPMMGLWGGGHMWNGRMWDGTGATWMWLLMLLVPLLVLLGIVYLLYSVIRQPSTQQQDTAIEELRAAYVRGDISDEEFAERRERLQSKV